MDTDSGSHQESGSSSQASGVNPSGVTRGAWMGSNVTQYEIDWLYRSRRIPEGVTCRLPGDEIEPVLEPGEHVVFLAHFERGFGLPASEFFRKFLDFYELQPHHLPGNAIFYLSCFATFMEAYIGIRPTRETFARFFALRINSVQGKEIPKPKPPFNAGLASSAPREPFLQIYRSRVMPAMARDLLLREEQRRRKSHRFAAIQPRRRANWGYNRTDHIETNRVVRFMANLVKETNICSDDIIRTFISRRVLPLKRRQHRMSEMYGPGDPTKITGLPLSKRDVVRKAKQICQTAMSDDWEWGLLPLSTTNPPTQEAKDRFPTIHAERRGPCVKRALDSVDPDPYIRWRDLKMGKTKASRLGPSVPEPTGSSDDLTVLEIHEHTPPLQAEAGHEFVDKLMAQGQKNKAPASDAGSSQAPPPKRFRTEPLGQKEVGVRRYKRKQMPTSSGFHVGAGISGVAPHYIPPPSTFNVLLDSSVRLNQVSSGNATFLAITVNLHGCAPSAPSSPRTAPTPPPDAPRAEPAGATPTPPPPKTSKLIKGKAMASSAPSSGPQPLVLHVSRAASTTSEKATGLLGRITDFKREGRELGHLLPYAQKWNAADMSPATRGMGKDRLPLPDPVGNRSSEEHFMRLRRAVKELDSAWYDATNNRWSSLRSFYGSTGILLRHMTIIPEASIEALKAQLATAQQEKDQLIRQHQEELSAQKTSYQELKGQLIQLGLDHAKALKAAEADAAAKLHEAPEDTGNAHVVLQAELEEAAKARKAVEDKAARLEAERKEYDRLITQTDAHAFPTQLFRLSAGEVVRTPSPSSTASRVPARGSGVAQLRAVGALSLRVACSGTGAGLGRPHRSRQ
ncbi:hypothetical protein QYE76_027354 [Lolium multiflorum]|uniref:Transposase (putative) gypsy type domain-containing protein n=1 Tax=Lolium multiflorum TaxID=4521 RepID=A0AAD8VFY8_LOLMU|nr:hypothetical protein QYE76_027354 [Lolium multiflorum]